jgi:phage baseplate assembly protein W
MSRYYELPIRFSRLMERNQELPTCDLKKSIAQNIFLIISSRFNEHRFDPTYGCELWDRDFELIANRLVWQEQIGISITRSLVQHEARLEAIKVDTEVTEEPYQNPVTKLRIVKKRLNVTIKGKITQTGEDFHFSTQLFMSPISID